MLDGLLGRGFASKCKSLIKLTTTRVDAIRKKRNATQKFLKKDIADLLANGHEDNAFGRAEGLLVELCFSSCYDFIEKCCECVLKNLSAMQKQSQCPEECRVAVSSLMFAAARFSDLPELRDLRHIFQEKYGNSLEYFANQKFVEILASKPPMLEKKVRLMQDIASEFLIKWDGTAFELRMSKPPASSSLKTYGPAHTDDKFKLPNAKENKYKFHYGKESSTIAERHDAVPKDVNVQTIVRDCNVSKRDEDPQLFGRHMSKHKPPNGRELNSVKENCDVPFQGRHESNADWHEMWNRNEEQTAAKSERLGSSSHGKTLECLGGDCKLLNSTDNTAFGRDGPFTSTHGEPELGPIKKLPIRSDGNETSFAGINHVGRHQISNSTRNVQEEEKERTKPPYNVVTPPPYHKSSRTKSKDAGFDCNGAPMDPSTQVGDDVVSGLEGTHIGINHPGFDRQVVGSARVDSLEEHHFEDDKTGNTIPKRRSSRRRHLKLPPSHDDHGTIQDVGVAKRNSSGRRRMKSRQGLQILLDDASEHHQKDEDERMLDKLLLHYSHKPSSYDPEKVQHKLKADPSHHMATETQHKGSGDKSQVNPKVVPHPARSVSLPHEQTAQMEAPKVFSRMASLQPARHVHPKLPDYDDLAARFAAMKAK